MSERPPQEIELKLAATAAAMETLLASSLLKEHARSTVRARHLVSTYYDTDDHRFSQRMIAFRVRQNGQKFIQTLKAAAEGEDALQARSEWEVELPDGTPSLTAFGDQVVHELTGLVLPDELVPIFETRFKRRALLVTWPGLKGETAEIEVAFDAGAILAGGHEQPISEIELELKRGDTTALYELADSLRELAPFRLQTQDKATRGYELALGTKPAWRKAKPVTLAPEMSVDDALRRILGACQAHWLFNEAATVEASDPEGLHQLRVAIRRMRSALSLFKTALGDQARERWTAELRWFLGPLGPARDLDVFATEVMTPVLAARPQDPALEALREAVDERRHEAHARMREAFASGRYGDLAFHLATWIARRGWRQGADVDVLLAQRQNVREFATAILAKRYRQVKKRGKNFANLSAEARHELRIAMKKLRYGTEFFQSLFPKKEVDAFRKAAAEMQDVLGHLNDVAVAQNLVHDLLDGVPPGPRQRAAALGGGQVLGWYAHASSLLEPKAVEAWHAFRAAQPFWSEPA